MMLTIFYYAFRDSRAAVLTLLGVIYLFAMHLVMPNNGGSGADMPEPLLIWGIMLLLMAVGYGFFLHRRLACNLVLRLMSVAALLLTLPLLWCPQRSWALDSLPRLGGVWAGVALYCLLLNCRFTARQKRGLVYLIAISALIQTIYSLAGLHFPSCLPAFAQTVLKQGIGLGVFQQRNVTASFLAAGAGALLFSLGDRAFQPAYRSWEGLRRTGIACGVVLIYCTLTEMQSRIGWLSALCVFAGMLGVFWRKGTPVTVRLLLLGSPLAGMGIGVWLVHGSLLGALEQHDGSNLQRLMVLRETWRMIELHPLKGWGYGSYEWNFSHFIADRISPISNGASVLTHPHNEVLFWWVEGGVAALAGLLMFCAAGARLLFTSPRREKVALFICAMPLLLHTQVEYPFYQSPVHWLTLNVLLSMMDTLPQQERRVSRINAGAAAASALAVLMMSLVGESFQNQEVMTAFELHPTANYAKVLTLHNTGIGIERLERLQAEALIVAYQQEHDKEKLRQFSHYATRWLQIWVNANMYDNLINVDAYLGNHAAGERLKIDAHRLFVADSRFD